jgi:hypothetical protein
VTTTRWAVVGLVTALVLFGLGGLLGYRAGTSSDVEHRLWRETTKQLADSLAREHRQQLAAVRDSVAADSAARVAAEEGARRAGSRARAAQAEADTLEAELALATHHLDSLRLYPQVVAKLRTKIRQDSLKTESIKLALEAEKKSTARLARMVGSQVAMIGQLQEQVARIPKPQRHGGIRILGMDLKPCAFAGMSTDARTATGVGICVTK